MVLKTIGKFVHTYLHTMKFVFTVNRVHFVRYYCKTSNSSAKNIFKSIFRTGLYESKSVLFQPIYH